MSLTFLSEAFSRLSKINEDVFDFTDKGIAELSQALNDDSEENIPVIDADAETKDDLQTAYVGSIVIKCPVCQTNIFKKKEDVSIDAGQEMANIDEMCPYCGEAEGFIIVGQIGEVTNDIVKEPIKEKCEKKNQIRENIYRIKYFDVNNPEEDLQSKVFAKDRQSAINKLLKGYDDFRIEDVTLLKGKEPEVVDTDAKSTRDFVPACATPDLSESVNVDLASINDDIIAILKKNGFDTQDKSVINYAKAAAEYVYMVDETYSVEEWYEDTKNNYPEDLKELKRVNESNNIIVETPDGAQSLSEIIGNYKSIYDSIQSKIKYYYDKGRKDTAYSAVRKMLYEIAKDFSLRTNQAEREEMAKEEVDDYFKFHDKQKQNNLTESTQNNPLDELGNSNIIEFPNGEYVYVGYEDGVLYAGGATNAGIIREFEIEYDHDLTLDDNLGELYETIIDLHPEYLDDTLNEAIEDVSIKTDTQNIEISDDVITIGSSNKEEDEDNIEVIQPLDDDIKDEILFADEEEGGEEEEVEMVDMDIDEIKEENFNQIGKKFLTKTYENVQDFKITSASSKGNSLILEGLIHFKSGNKKKTQFIFEAKDITKTNRVRFVGRNPHLCEGKKPFILSGQIKDGNILVESMNYNFTTQDQEGNTSKITGTVSIKD